jgi:SAM-dependent methyltransferase
VPVFDSQDENTNEYTVTQATAIHDNALRWLFATFGVNEATLRNNIISKLHLKAGQKILITGVGAGNDLPFVAQLLGKEGEIFAQDFSIQMLRSAVERSKNLYGLSDYNIEFSVSDATNLPFFDKFFDAVYHFGGLNLFSNIAKGIAEMDRVVKNGGRVVFGDEGLAPWLKNTDYGRMLINNNPLYNFEAPLTSLPSTAREVNLSWEVGHCFYVIEYTASDVPLAVNIDVPHVGRRGGTIRTRYYGQLEGIDPTLKKLLYDEAEKLGVSRVEFLERVLRNGLEN